MSLPSLPGRIFLSLPGIALVRFAFRRAHGGGLFLSLLFSLFYGYAAARNRTARTVLMPLLDVLQSVPILSFLPVVLLSLTAILPKHGRRARRHRADLYLTSVEYDFQFLSVDDHDSE